MRTSYHELHRDRIAAAFHRPYVRRMPLVSRLFRGDPKLEAALTNDQAHITPGARGDHVNKIQTALLIADNASVASFELDTKSYGTSTAAAILNFKKKRNIINRAYQTTADNIVGKMTVAALDQAVAQHEAQGSPRGIVFKPDFT